MKSDDGAVCTVQSTRAQHIVVGSDLFIFFWRKMTGKGKKFGSAILYAFAFPDGQLVSCTYVDSINQTRPLQAKVFFAVTH